MAAIVLGALLVQVALFCLGFYDPYQRAFLLWGKSLEQRRQVVGPGAQLMRFAEQFPLNAKIYWVEPQLHLHWNANYYFYPREIYISMTNGTYRYPQDYQQWNERPSEGWLASNKFTHVLGPTNIVTANGVEHTLVYRAVRPLLPEENILGGTAR